MAEPFKVVYESTDPTEAEMLAEVLCRNGIDARLIGTRHAAMIAAAQHIAPVRIEVPESRAVQARELVEALQAEVDEGEEDR